jgi:hypothetical protein
VLQVFDLHTGIAPLGSVHGAVSLLMAQLSCICLKFTPQLCADSLTQLGALHTLLLQHMSSDKVRQYLARYSVVPTK